MQLYRHQISAIHSAVTRRHILIIRALGGGKTAIALHIVKHYLDNKQGPALLVGPAHLLNQYCSEVCKWKLGYDMSIIRTQLPVRFERNACFCISYDMLRRHRSRLIAERFPVVIVDEFQHGKNPDTHNSAIFSALRESSTSFVGMTGTPFQNGPYEFFNLLSLIAGRSLRHVCEDLLEYRIKREDSVFKLIIFKLLNRRRNRGPIVGIRSPLKLRELILRYVDYVCSTQCQEQGGIPSVCEEIRYVDIDGEELAAYTHILRKHRKRKDALFFEDSLEDESLEGVSRRLSDLRQCLLCCNSTPSSKVREIVATVRECIASTENRILIFSNFVSNGVDSISHALKRESLPHNVYTGSVNKLTREQIVHDFTSGNVRTLVLSPVGHEGLDLVGASHVLIADPHYNPERTNQLIARATRSGGSIKVVRAIHFLARSPALKNGTIDEAIWRISQRKSRVNEMIASLMKC